MKFFALIAAARAAIHADCNQTWVNATDDACDGAAGEICFNWLDKAPTDPAATSLGLKCGLNNTCGTLFKYAGGGDTEFWAQCDGLSKTDCSADKTVCDSFYKDKDGKGFKCSDWVPTAGGNVTLGCAAPFECGKTVAGAMVACSGLLGDECSMDSECDTNAKYRCGALFNNQTYSFHNDTKPMCVAGDVCGTNKTVKDAHDITLCYKDVSVKCTNETSCETPDGDNGEVSCGWLAPNGTNLTSGMCVDKAYCGPNTFNVSGGTVKYFGKDTMLWCGSARTALAMGAAAISAYLAM